MLAPSTATHQGPAPVGHNSRRTDIERSADELRKALLTRENEGANAKQRILNHALVSPSVTDAEYRILSLELKHADRNGAGCFIDPENGAAILGRSLSKYERAIKGLVTKGWCGKKRRFNSTSVRNYAVPEGILRTSAELFELLEQERETANPPIHSNETADLPNSSKERNGKFAGETANLTP